ncbi:hypothetical protein GJAV_G00215550 [Gymnothorax javanicus]|nr:hypothetical protein GJAV_G00215550 [Gymnothorax javanicus]
MGPLPMNCRARFWVNYKERDIRKFLKKLRKQNKPDRKILRGLFKELRSTRIIQEADECIEGDITPVTISNDDFPFGFDAAQFNHCLSVSVVRDNVAGLAAKVDEIEFQTIVLEKYHQAFPSGLSDAQVQALGPLSRVATLSHISTWSITTLDALAFLMKPEDGEWDSEKSKAIITKFLETPGNTLGSSELNAIGGPNLCSLSVSVQETITSDSLMSTNVLNVETCSVEQKTVLFTTAQQAFNEPDSVSLMTFQFMKSFLGGASREYIQTLSKASVSMDVDTFRNLNPTVLSSLSVTEVKDLLGDNVDDLKTYENTIEVQKWISNQRKADLETLGLNLSGTQVTPTTTASQKTPTSPSPVSSSPASSTQASPSPASSSPGLTTTMSGNASASPESRICSGVQTDEFQNFLDSGKTGLLCSFTIAEYACSSLESLTGPTLAEVLKCKVPDDMNMTSKETWKRFFTKADGVLDEALSILTNMSVNLRNPTVLEVVGEQRIDSLTEEQLQSVPVIGNLFHKKLRTLLSAVSKDFLSSLVRKNFTCEIYQHVMAEFNYQFPHMEERTQQMVVKHFIRPFLTRNHTSDPGCVESTNGSVEWLQQNFMQFSTLVPVQTLHELNPDFRPLEALSVLSPQQAAELLSSPHPSLPDEEEVTEAVFEHFTQSQNEEALEEFLEELEMQSGEATLSCGTYKIILSDVEQVASSGSSELESIGGKIKGKLSQTALLDCPVTAILPGCPVTPANESRVCAGINRGEPTGMMLCDHDIRHFACQPMPTNLTSDDVATILRCNFRGNETHSLETWGVFAVKNKDMLYGAFKILAETPEIPSLRPSYATLVLDALGETLLDKLALSSKNKSKTSRIFGSLLKPFLPFMSKDALSCLSTMNYTCQTFEVVSSDSRPWVERNFGKFAEFLDFEDIQRLNGDVSKEELLPQLSVEQLAEVSASAGQLETAKDVVDVLSHVPDDQLGIFMDDFSAAIMDEPLPIEARQEMLQQVLDRANLSDPAISDKEVEEWLENRLPVLMPNMRQEHVVRVFSIVRQRGCNISQEPVNLLSAVRSTLDEDTVKEVLKNIQDSLQGPTPLRCYTSGSFSQFVINNYVDFPTPNLSTLLGLIPPNRQGELINSVSPSELGELLRKPMFIDDSADLCSVLQRHTGTPSLLEQEEFLENTRSQILPCVWPLALEAEDEEEVNRWFGIRLTGYFMFLNKDLIDSDTTINASCLAFRELVTVLGHNHTFDSSDFNESDVYDTIKTYVSTDGSPKCYDPNDPKLNSTAWFANYFGKFIRFADSDDFNTFGSEETLRVFSTNPENIELFSQPEVQEDVSSLYTEFLFEQNPEFDPTRLPGRLHCHVPGDALSQLDESQSLEILSSLNQSCTDVEPEVSASLAANIETITPDALAALGNKVTGLSTVQILKTPPSVLKVSLTMLGEASGWSQAQSMAIIEVLRIDNFVINSPENLLNLGSLIGGVPSASMSSISPTVALQSASNPVFVSHVVNAPTYLQQVFVTQVITENPDPLVLLDNIPDELASQIPTSLMVFPTTLDPSVVTKMNKKKWKPEQAAVIFDKVSAGTEDAEVLSTEMLQGFSCTRVQTFKKTKVRNLIRACRRRKNRSKVILREPQLTCMNNHVKQEKSQIFTDFPSDMLLYYDYSNVQQASCKAYFIETGHADFDVLSEALSGKKAELLSNAKSCLSITGTNLNRENVEVLGNMCCTLDESYIKDSDPLILEKLKNCNSFSDKQVTAIEDALVSGTSQYGEPSTWTFGTLERLGPLPINLGRGFWRHFKKRDIRKFLRKLRKQKKRERKKLRKLFKEIRGTRLRRAADQCTVGSITQVTIRRGDFPFGYDATQFNHCLSVSVVKDNVAGLAAKVDEREFQTIALQKYHQAFPSGLSDTQVRTLGPLSRVATLSHISMWRIRTLDALASLMDPNDGDWDSEKSEAIITKYLETTGNTLTSFELNAIGGPNLCSLPVSVLKTITPDNLKGANSLNVQTCSMEQKTELFTTAERAFNEPDPFSLMTFQCIKPFLGGAPREYIQTLSKAGVSMDMETFRSLNPTVLSSLTVTEVKGLLGDNVDDLKTYEHTIKIQTWIMNRTQAALNTLGLNITGGIETATTTQILPHHPVNLDKARFLPTSSHCLLF